MSKKEDSEIFIVTDYSEKAFAVYGNTKPYTEEIKKLKGKAGRYMPLRHGRGWIFSSASEDHKKVKQFLIKKGAVLIKDSAYKKIAVQKEVQKKKSTEKTVRKTTRDSKSKEVEKKAPRKRTEKKEVPIAGPDFYERDEEEKQKVKKFINSKKAALIKFFRLYTENEVMFHHLAQYIDEISKNDNSSFDQYGVSAHVFISEILPVSPSRLSMGIMLARVLRSEFEGRKDLLEKLEKWVKSYDPKDFVKEVKRAKKTPKKSVKRASKKSNSSKKVSEKEESSSEEEEHPPKKKKSPAKKPAKKASKKTTKKSAKKTTKKATKKSAKKATKKTTKK